MLKGTLKRIDRIIANFYGFYTQSQVNEITEDIYEDRNSVVLSYMRSLDDQGYDVGWKEADDTDSSWVVVWAMIPKGNDVHSQVAWHLPREKVEGLDWLKKEFREYDGHSDREKRDRLERFIQR